MGQTVVFTVPLDPDGEVGIERTESRPPPRHPFRDALLEAFRSRRWRLAALLTLALPALAAGATRLITGGAWVSTAFVLAAALVTPASAAWAGARVPAGSWDERVAAWAATGVAGAGLALTAVPGLLWAARGEAGSFAGPTLGVLALAGAAGAWLGLVVGGRALAVTAALLIGLGPLAAYAAMLPTTELTEEITSYEFVAAYGERFGVAAPYFICGQAQVEATRYHTEYIAWMAFASPLAWTIDAANVEGTDLKQAADGTATQAHAWVRSTQVGPDGFTGYCYQPTSLAQPEAVKDARYGQSRAWGTQVATASAMGLGVLALAVVTVRRRQSVAVTVTVSEPTR